MPDFEGLIKTWWKIDDNIRSNQKFVAVKIELFNLNFEFCNTSKQ